MKKFLCVLIAILIVAVFAGCDNINPALKKDSDSDVVYNESESDDKEIPEYIDADALANRSYELRYLLAQNSFNSPSEISVSALVQYAFCHMFYENLVDMPTEGIQLRIATADPIKQIITENFGELDIDLTKADLYNIAKKKFEMWEPLYGTEIFYDVKVVRSDDDTYKARTTFYTDDSKSEVLGKTVLTVKDTDGKITIQKLTSSN
ncbi:MAG: hypothetical protein K2K01_04050 [Eubacterium sp.]|nr:hypothetical protein [Eubacterium sp.]